MTTTVAEDVRHRVFEKVRRCLENLGGGGGHLGAYTLEGDTFRIESARDVGDGLTEYSFTVDGWLQTEFDWCECGEPRKAGDPPADEFVDPCRSRRPEHLAGALVLDGQFAIVLDAEGRVRLRPWKTIDPRFWP